MRDQTEEISLMSDRYRRALKQKVQLYDQLTKAVQTLAQNNGKYMENEIELCRLGNLVSIEQKELDQQRAIIGQYGDFVA